MPRINLNADLGEGYGPWTMGDDDAMLAIVNSANVACGGHAGDPDVMRRTLRLAREHGVSIGAHPSYPDLRNFGRRAMSLAPAELENQLAAQIGALMGIAAMEGIRVSHVKPHGALNNQACVDRALADTICRTVRAIDPALILLAPAASQLVAAGHAAGLSVVEEIFADRAYLPDGQLVPRSRPECHGPRPHCLPRPRAENARRRGADRNRRHPHPDADRQHLRPWRQSRCHRGGAPSAPGIGGHRLRKRPLARACDRKLTVTIAS
jgi:UPF0271 protein